MFEYRNPLMLGIEKSKQKSDKNSELEGGIANVIELSVIAYRSER